MCNEASVRDNQSKYENTRNEFGTEELIITKGKIKLEILSISNKCYS